jgi:hypothetical protein
MILVFMLEGEWVKTLVAATQAMMVTAPSKS